MTDTGGGSLLGCFRAAASKWPNAAAVVEGSRALSYGSLDENSTRLACHLVAAGAEPGHFVGLCVARGAPALTGVLGILKAGAAYVPLDPSYPRERLEFMCQDCGAPVAITDPASPALKGPQLLELQACLDAPAARATLPDPEAESPAYVIYTSGSTGQPKGVVVTHANVIALLRSGRQLFEVSADDRWSLFSSYSFDVSVWEMWMAVATGATCVTVPADVARNPDALVALLASTQVTVLNIVPSVFRHLVRAYARRGGPPLALRYVVFAGEPLDRGSIRAFQAAAPEGHRPRWINMYGITETTVHATFKELGSDDLAGSGPTPIGAPLPHLGIRLLAEDGTPVQDGEEGEIWVLGEGVAQGYLNRPEITRERFRRLPLEGLPSPAYRSGDLARRRPDGELEYLGRADAQLKLRGFRVEPGEIEHALRDHPAIAEAAVVKVDASSDPILVAVVQYEHGDRPASAELRAFLGRRLPSHLIPNRVIAVEALAVSPTGKLDRSQAQTLADAALATPPPGRRSNP